MKSYTHFIFRFKRIFILLFIALNCLAILGITQIKLDTDFASFSPDESIYQDRLDDMETVFGELNQLIVVVETDYITPTVLDDMQSLQQNLSSIDHISYVQGAAPSELIIEGNPMNYDQLSSEDVLSYYSAFDDFSPLKTTENGYAFVFTLFINDDFSNKSIQAIENTLNSIDYDSYVSGDAYNQLKITDYILKILLILPPLALLIIFFVFRWQMGATIPTLLSILPAGIGSLWTFGLIGWIGNQVSILTAVVPIFIIVIGSADGLHFMSHYQDAKQAGQTNIDALINTLQLVGIPMIVTTLTSMVGFISLLTIHTSSIQSLSIYSAVGILLAGVATWYVLPLILTNPINVKRKKTTSLHIDFSSGLKKLVGLPSFIFVIIILLVSTISFSHINNEFNMLMVYKDSTIVSKNAKKINEINGGSIPLFVTIESENDMLSLESMKTVQDITDQINELEEVNKIVNPFELIRIVYNNQFSGEIPNDIVLNNIYQQLSLDPNNTIHDLIADDHQTIRLLIFPRDLKNNTLLTIESTVNTLDAITTITGVQYLMLDLNQSISTMQFTSIILALVLVLFMLIINLKSVKIAIFSLLPILLTVISLYGFLGISQIPLNITTVIIFSITIGVGIDYAVHFSSVYKHYYKETQNNDQAIRQAYANSSRPIIANALGISLGLTILVLSPLTIHFNVSMLMWVSMIVSVVLTLTLLPYIFRKFGGNKHAKTDVL